MKLTNSGFQREYNPIIMEGSASDMSIDFDELLMEKGGTVNYNGPKECIYVPVTGKVIFRWTDKEETMGRKSCFHEDPILLHVPQSTAVKLVRQPDKVEVSIQHTANPRHPEPKLVEGEDLLRSFELQGIGLMNGAFTRIVRTFLGCPDCPETSFFIGEVVNHPGKWSSFPPYTHAEPEIYFRRFLPESGYGYTEVRDTVYEVHRSDVTHMTHGVIHNQATTPRYMEYYTRTIRLRDNDSVVITIVPEHTWMTEKDVRYFPEI